MRARLRAQLRADLLRLACAMLLTGAAAPATAQDHPPASYDSWGVCPFECCSYGEWTAAGDIPVHQSRSDQSPVLFRLRQGEPLSGLTGVVVTERPARITIDRPVRDGYLQGKDGPQLSLKSGDTIYFLSPLGEGAYLYWYRGKVYKSGIDMAAMPGADAQGAKMTWWKLVRNQAGGVGWTRSDQFQNVDACG